MTVRQSRAMWLMWLMCLWAVAVLGASCRAAPVRSSLAGAVSAAPESAAPVAPAPVAASDFVEQPRLEVAWDPSTGRGEVRHFFANGDRARTCFHCGYNGYTGGLVVGNLNDSGFAFVPRTPVRGYRSINVFCATDESIWDLDQAAEYTYGWSENFGRGDDGLRLGYVKGRVLEAGPERVVLESENAGGCYRVTKVASTRADAPWWIIATAVTNTCAHPVHFDFFTGDDPWLGLYRSSDGDVGWTPSGLLERETEIAPFTEGGIYDQGNRAMGQTPEPFSNQANFFMIDPGTPLPDRAFLANRFAHVRGEIDLQHVLTNDKMIALNLGWTHQTLAPGATLTVALAMGLAKTGAPGQVPSVPTLRDEDWSVWRRWLPGQRAKHPLEFVAEEVELTVEEGRLTVDAVYHFSNAGAASASLGVRYPVYSDAHQLAPTTISVDGRELVVDAEPELDAEVSRPSVVFPFALGPHSLSRFAVHYEQKLTSKRAVYLVTTARTWPSPITRAIFRVRRPARLKDARASLPVVSSRRSGDTIEDTLVERDFAPTSELVVTW